MSTRAPEKNGSTSVLALLHNRPFALLWLAQMISNLGDNALLIVIPVTVYQATHSKSALGIAFVCGTLPALLFSLLGGVLADRWPQRRTMIAADLARMASISLLLFVRSVKHFGPHDLSLFYIVSFLIASFSCFFSPARQSLLRVLVPREQLVQANSATFSGSQTCALIGPALGGLLLAYFSAKSVFVFDALTFAASALLVGFIRIPAGAAPDIRKPRRGPAGVLADANEGVTFLTRSRILRPALTMLLFAVTASQITNTLEFPFVRDVWHGGPSQYAGLVSLSFGAAFLAGASGMGPLRSVLPARLLLIGFTIQGLTGLVFAQTTGIVIGGAMLFVSCLGNGILNIGNMVLFQTTAPPHMQGRVSATISLCIKMAMTLGGLLMAGLTTLVPGPGGLRPIFTGVAVAYLLCGLLAWFTLGHLTEQDVLETAAANAAPPEPAPEPVAAGDRTEPKRV